MPNNSNIPNFMTQERLWVQRREDTQTWQAEGVEGGIESSESTNLFLFSFLLLFLNFLQKQYSS